VDLSRANLRELKAIRERLANKLESVLQKNPDNASESGLTDRN